MKKEIRINLLIITIALIVGTIIYIEKPFSRQYNLNEIQTKLVITENGTLEQDTSNYPTADEIEGIAHWINSEPLTIQGLKGKVVLVDFWTYSCINCIRTLPYIKEWHEKYADLGLVIIGIHTPEFRFEKDISNVENAVEEFGIKFPVAMDNDYTTWKNFDNHYWPHKYLIDKDGKIRYDHIGEGSYSETEEMIVELLKEIDNSVEMKESSLKETENGISGAFQTPELYGGYSFARVDLGNKESYKPTQIVYYEKPDFLTANRIYASGKWKNNEDNLHHLDNESKEGSILLSYTSKAVHIVADTAQPGKAAMVDVMLDGKYMTKENAGRDVFIDDQTKRSFVEVNQARLYNIVSGDLPFGSHKLEIISKDNNFMFYTFTFGSK